MRSLFIPVLAMCACSLSAMAGTVLFSDLGSSGTLYNSSLGDTVDGATGTFDSFAVASLFTVSGAGSLAVSEIDLAVAEISAPFTFSASIWTDSAGLPGSQVANAYWNLSTGTVGCCSLVSIAGISGVSLTGGQQYFMILDPPSLTSSSDVDWYYNNQGATGLVLGSVNGGPFGGGTMTLPAFDVLSGTSVPEPGSLLLLGTGLLGMLGVAYRRASLTARNNLRG